MSMKLSTETLNILKNMASINVNLFFTGGDNELVTCSKTNTILCRAVCKETFPKDAGIYDLNSFLGALSLFEEPSLDFDEKWCVISDSKDARRKLKYFYADKKVLILAPKKELPIDGEDVVLQFKLSASDLKSIVKSASLMQLDSIAIAADTDRASVGAKNNSSGNEQSNNFSLDISGIVVRGPKFDKTKTFEMVFDKLNINPLSGVDYTVTLTEKFARFVCTSDGYDVTYWYAPKTGS